MYDLANKCMLTFFRHWDFNIFGDHTHFRQIALHHGVISGLFHESCGISTVRVAMINVHQ